MTEQNLPAEAQFNQAVFQQQRINELLLRVDRLSINPLEFNPVFNSYNYEIICNDLCSVLLTISAKLSPGEKKEMLEMKSYLKDKITTYPVFSRKFDRGWTTREKNYFRPKVWEAINTLLFDFRIRLEELMDVHGYGNPSKDDPRSRFGKG